MTVCISDWKCILSPNRVRSKYSLEKHALIHPCFLAQLLCKSPAQRLHCLERFKMQRFFFGTSFDSQLLQKTPMELILELKKHPDRPEKARRGVTSDPFQNFDYDLFSSLSSPTDLSPTLVNAEPHLDLTGYESLHMWHSHNGLPHAERSATFV